MKENSIPGLVNDPSVVMQSVDEAGMSLTNTTTDRHFLRNGTVTRSILTTDNAIFVVTAGVGQNIALNMFFGLSVPSSVMSRVNNLLGLYFLVLDVDISTNIYLQGNPSLITHPTSF